MVTIEGMVRRFALVLPDEVSLRGKAGHQISDYSLIIPNDDHPFKVVDVSMEKNTNVKCWFQEIKKGKKSEYTIMFENIRNVAGQYTEVVHVKTDSQIKPEIQIKVKGDIY